MAGQTKVHPTAVDIASIQYLGTKELTVFELDFGAAVNTKTGPESAIAKAIEKIAQHCTILLRSELHSTNQVMTFFIEHPNTTDTYDGTNAETFVVFLASELVALGIVDGVNFAGSSCTVKTTLNIA
jgi:hypothetical protein